MAEVAVSIQKGRDLTAMQRSLWASQAKSPSSPHQNTALLWHIDGPLDLDRLAEAFAAVVEASDVLRTTIATNSGRAMAVLTREPANTEQLAMTVAETQGWAAQRASKIMDSTVSLFDSAAIDHGDGTVSWFLNLHHAITDASSSALVFAATARAYADEELNIDSYYGWADEQEDHKRTVKAQQYWASHNLSPKVGRMYGPAGNSISQAERLEVPLQNFRSELDQLLSGRFGSISEDLAWTSFLLTATAVLIHRTSGAESFSIGLPLHNRSGAVAQAIIGPVMEVFPVAIEIEAQDTFASLHKRISRSAMETIRKAKPGSAPNQVNFESIVNVIPRGGVTYFGNHPATTTWVHPGSVDPSHLLRVQLTTYAGGPPRIELDVNHAIGSTDERRRIPVHFDSVLAEFVANPDSGIGSFTLLDVDEIETVTAWGTGAVPGSTMPIDVVSKLEGALRSNVGIALTDGDQKLTGPEVWGRVEALAKSLVVSGVSAGVRVGIEMDRTVDAVVAIYSVLAAGGSYVPLDPSQPENRRQQLITRAGCAMVIREIPPLAEGSESVELPTISLEDEAYLLFTSGSTGEPKGVPIAHLGLADYLAYAQDAYVGNSGAPAAALFTPLTFDLTVTSLFMPLIAGGQLMTVAANGLEGLMAVAKAKQLTWLKATPSHLELLLRLVEPGHQLRSLVVGGEAFTSRLARQLWATFDEVSLFNEYGPTEAVVGCMFYKASTKDLEGVTDVPIGAPSPGVTLAVVDQYLQLVPVGAVGELLIASRGLTAGYLPSSDDSDPGHGKFADIDRIRYYRSGDLVRLIDNETLVYHGRADSQIKVGGIRLEPTEVEAELEAHPAIRRAAARIWSPKQTEIVQHCARCGLPSNVPNAAFDEHGVCSVCHDYDRIAPQAEDYFGDTADLQRMLADAQRKRTGDYDCIHLLSGGKDSTFALYKLVELGFKVFALTFDNGFISEGAKENARASAADLGVELEFMGSEVMNEIFADSLSRHSNVCHGCYKTIYTLATTKADEIGAPIIFTGLSRGQLFETRLIPAQFTQDRFDPAAIDAAVVQARRVYHGIDDGPNRLLDTSVFDDGAVFDRVSYVDYYRYTDVSLAYMLDFLDSRAPWVRPSDTGRSTNCLVNAAGIYTHITEQGYHNYAEPYAWDVRLGHKTRDEAIAELDDQLDLEDVASMLEEIGYTPKRQEVFTGWIELEDGATEPTPGALRAFLADRLPKHAIPAAFVTMKELPTSDNGKLADSLLPRPDRIHRAVPVVRLEETSVTERSVVEVWERVLGTEPVGIDDDFFALGGDSLAALEMVVALSDALGRPIAEEIVFSHTTPRGLAGAIDALAGPETEISAVLASPIGARGEGEKPPLTPWEVAFVVEHMNDPDSGRQNVGRRYVINGQADIAKLAQAIQATVERHMPLRLTLSLEDRKLLPVARAVEITAGFSPIDESQLREVATVAIDQPFDIETGPLLRAAIHPMEGGATGVVIVAHHGVTDLAGLERVWTDIDRAYHGKQLASLDDEYLAHVARHNLALAAADTSWVVTDSATPSRFDLGPIQDGPDGYLQVEASFDAQTLATVAGATPMATVLCGLLASLRPHNSSDTLTVGLPVSTRERNASELAGNWLNTVPVQLNVEPEVSFAELLGRCASALGTALSRKLVPASTVNKLRRGAGLNPVEPQFIFAYSEFAEAKLGGFNANHEIISGSTVRAPIAFFAEVRGDSVMLGLEYSGTVLDESSARQLLRAFDSSVSKLIHRPQAPAVPGVSASSTLLSEQPRGEASEAAFEPLGAMVARFATTSPHAVAVDDGKLSLTYLDLNQRAESVACHLTAAGVGLGSRVGVFAPRNAQTTVGILGVLLAGAAYVALDPDYPLERLRFVADDGALEAVVATVSDAASAVELGLPVILSDGPINSIEDSALVFPTPSPDDPAYLIYTSGSTGQPKGVVVSHGNIVQSTRTRTQVYGSDPTSFLLLSSFSFDSSMVGLFWTLTTGGSLILPEHGLHTDVTHLALRILEMGVSHTLAVPALYRVLLEETRAENLSGLQAVIVAGESCSADLVVSHMAKLESVELHNEYGPTETTVWSHHFQFDASIDADSVIPIGTSIPGVVSAVVDYDGRQVSVGETGELLIGGFGVTGGYENRPAETSEKFVAAADYPDLEIEGNLYRTGDLVKLGDGGLLSFVGRVDRQVKVRGFRVEPELVEAELVAVEGVTGASVDLQDGRLVAWISTANFEDSSEPERVKAALVGRLPTHEVPAVVIPLAVLPRTVNGKIDRAALPVAGRVLNRDGQYDAEKLGGAEAQISEIWAGVLGLDIVRPGENFFDLGGDSILNIRIVARMRRAGFDVRPRDVFNNPTVSKLALLLDNATPAVAGLATEQMAGLVPMLEMQRWFFNQNFAKPNHWTQSIWLQLGPSAALETVEAAVQELVRNHAILRSRFLRSGGNWTQFVADEGPAVEFAKFESDANAVDVAAAVESTLDIESGRLLAVGVVPDEAGARLFVAAHHLVMDGVSWGTILEDWTRIYDQLRAGQPVDLGRRSASQADWARVIGNHQSAHHWPTVSTRNEARHSVSETLNARVSFAVDASPALIGDRVDASLVTAIGLAWCESQALSRFETTMESHGRDSDLAPNLDLTRTIGWFTSQFPIAVDLGPSPTPSSALAAVSQAVHAVPNLGVGFDSGDAELNLPGLAINYLGQLDRAVPTGTLFTSVGNFAAGISEANHRPHAVGVVAWISGGELVINWDGARSEINQERLDALAASTLEKLAAVADADPSASNIKTTGVDASTMAALENILGGLDI